MITALLGLQLLAMAFAIAPTAWEWLLSEEEPS